MQNNSDHETPQAEERDKISFIDSSLDDAGLSPAEFRIYCHVLRVAGKDGVCFQFLATIADHCGYCHSITRDALNHLTQIKMLRRNYIFGERNEYRINPPSEWALPTPLQKNRRGTKNLKGTPVKKPEEDPYKKNGGIRYSHKVTPIKGTPKRVVDENTLETEFESFWQAYPNKQARLDAEKAFYSARKKVALDALLAAVEKRKKSDDWKKDNGKYIPLPAKWLTGERWHDEMVVTRPTGQKANPGDGFPVETEDERNNGWYSPNNRKE